MGKTRSPDSEKAEILYHQGMRIKDIADELGIASNTVSNWKKRHMWDLSPLDREELRVTKESQKKKSQKKSQKKKRRVSQRKTVPRKPSGQQSYVRYDEDENSESLNEREEIFCIEYLRCFNATKAYMRAYPGSSYNAAMVSGCRKLRLDKIRKKIDELKQLRNSNYRLEPSDIWQKYMDIAFADMTEYLRFDEDGVILNDSQNVDGTLITEVRQGKDGVQIKLLDRMKALEWLADHIGMATEEQKKKLTLLQAQTDKLRQDEPEEQETVIIVNDVDEVLNDAENSENL